MIRSQAQTNASGVEVSDQWSPADDVAAAVAALTDGVWIFVFPLLMQAQSILAQIGGYYCTIAWSAGGSPTWLVNA